MMGSPVRVRASALLLEGRRPGLALPRAERGSLGREGGVEVDRDRRTDRGRAVRTGLPERVERRPALDAGLLERRRADRADEVARLDHRPTDRAARLDPAEALLDRADLDVAGMRLVERLG